MNDHRTAIEIIHEGKFAAEIAITLEYSGESWSPTMSIDDVRRLEATRMALRAGNVAEAGKYGKVFELKSLPAE